MRWLASLLVLTGGFALPAHAQEVFCGLGPPPGSADFDSYNERVNRQRVQLGYQFVCESNLLRFDYVSRAKPLTEASQRLVFKPVSLAATPLAGFELLGVIPESASALHRTFRSPQGRVIDLLEWDMSVDGGQVFRNKDLQTERVNGAPAQLVVLQAPGGGPAVSILYWTTNRRTYELMVDANIRTTTLRPSLFDLAQSIPAVVPPPEAAPCFDGAFRLPPELCDLGAPPTR